MKWYKKVSLLLLVAISGILSFGNSYASPAPTFEDDFAKKLTSSQADNKGRVERVFDISCVSKNQPLKQNIECLFFPGSNISGKSGGVLRDIMRYIGGILVFIYIVYTAIALLLEAKEGKSLTKALSKLLNVLIGSAMFFGAMRLFGTVINLNTLQGSNHLQESLSSHNGILFFVLSFLKGAAFFVAITMIVATGFRMMNPKAGESGDSKKLAKNLINIIFALVAMKVVDFIYFIASQANFAEQAGNFIIQTAKFLAYLAGGVIVVMLIYSGYLLIVDGGKGENFKKAKNTTINIILAVGALFFFLFVIYQIFSEFN